MPFRARQIGQLAAVEGSKLVAWVHGYIHPSGLSAFPPYLTFKV